jgi:hypothetical protein
MDSKFFDGIYEGESANGCKLGMGLTGGDFWPRINGCLNFYLGEDTMIIDWDAIIDVESIDAEPVSVHVPYDFSRTYYCAIRRANFCGNEEQAFDAVVRLVFDDNGILVEEAGCNDVFEIISKQVANSKCRLIWFFSPMDQSDGVKHFNVYSDGGTGNIDFVSPPEIVKYSEPGFYCFDTDSLAEGHYKFCIRSVTNDGKEKSDLGFVKVFINNQIPMGVESIRVK